MAKCKDKQDGKVLRSSKNSKNNTQDNLPSSSAEKTVKETINNSACPKQIKPGQGGTVNCSTSGQISLANERLSRSLKRRSIQNSSSTSHLSRSSSDSRLSSSSSSSCSSSEANYSPPAKRTPKHRRLTKKPASSVGQKSKNKSSRRSSSSSCSRSPQPCSSTTSQRIHRNKDSSSTTQGAAKNDSAGIVRPKPTQRSCARMTQKESARRSASPSSSPSRSRSLQANTSSSVDLEDIEEEYRNKPNGKRIPKEAVEYLEKLFYSKLEQGKPFLERGGEKKKVAKDTGLDPDTIRHWFERERAKIKIKIVDNENGEKPLIRREMSSQIKEILVAAYKTNKNPSENEIEELSKKTQFSSPKIMKWFRDERSAEVYKNSSRQKKDERNRKARLRRMKNKDEINERRRQKNRMKNPNRKRRHQEPEQEHVEGIEFDAPEPSRRPEPRLLLLRLLNVTFKESMKMVPARLTDDRKQFLVNKGFTEEKIDAWFEERKKQEEVIEAQKYPKAIEAQKYAILEWEFDQYKKIDEKRAEQISKQSHLPANEVYRWFLNKDHDIEETIYLEKRRKEARKIWKKDNVYSFRKLLQKDELAALDELLIRESPPVDLEIELMAGQYKNNNIGKRIIEKFLEKERIEEMNNCSEIGFLSDDPEKEKERRKLIKDIDRYPNVEEFLEATKNVKLSTKYILDYRRDFLMPRIC